MPLTNKSEFFKEFNINNEDFVKTGLDWKELEKIYDHYDLQIRSDDYELIAQVISNKLNKIGEVHSTKYRLKNPEHLIEKIIRKRIANPEDIIDFSNYQEKITDIIGVRVLHLFKEDWDEIHKYIVGELDIVGRPVAYYRDGDSPDLLEHFEKNDCDTEKHKFGYRSVHYLAKSSLFKKQFVVEIQVRTIFEEGWSEVDHKLKYPYVKNNIVLEKFLGILNRFAGGADEMCSFITYLQLEFDKNNETISLLKDKVDKLEIEASKKVEIKQNIDGLGGMFFNTSVLNETMQNARQVLGSINVSEMMNATRVAHESLSLAAESATKVLENANNFVIPTSFNGVLKLPDASLKSEKLDILPKTQSDVGIKKES